MKSFKKIFTVIILLCLLLESKAQSSKKMDSLSTNVINAVYVNETEALQDSNLVKTKGKSSFNAYPYVFYTPETKLAFGAGGIFIFYGGKGEALKPSKIGFGGYYSTNKQYKISMNNTYYLFNNKLYIDLPISFGFFINKYFGNGDEASVYDNASYSVKTFTTTLTVQLPPKWLMSDRAGLIFDYDYSEIVDKRGNEYLENDSVPGSNGGTLMGFGTDILWDNRDNIFFPNSGGYQYFKLLIYPGISDYVFGTIEFDLKHFHAFSKDHVLAANVFVQSAFGETPFYKLSQLGGMKRMRGYFFGRYRDNFYAMMQMEYRQYFWKRFGFVVFAGLGNVSDEILNYDFNTLKYSLGGGLRFKFNEKEGVNLRMDVGFGNDGNMGIYFGIQEAF